MKDNKTWVILVLLVLFYSVLMSCSSDEKDSLMTYDGRSDYNIIYPYRCFNSLCLVDDIEYQYYVNRFGAIFYRDNANDKEYKHSHDRITYDSIIVNINGSQSELLLMQNQIDRFYYSIADAYVLEFKSGEYETYDGKVVICKDSIYESDKNYGNKWLLLPLSDYKLVMYKESNKIVRQSDSINTQFKNKVIGTSDGQYIFFTLNDTIYKFEGAGLDEAVFSMVEPKEEHIGNLKKR